MPTYQIYSLNSKDLGEGIRLLLSYGGKFFEDKGVPDPLEPSDIMHCIWYQHHHQIIKTPFGHFPVLEIDSNRYAHSNAICRYLGHKFGVAGATPEEDLEIDQVLEFVHDIRAKVALVDYEKDEALKAKKHEENCKDVYPVSLPKLDEIINKNNGHLALGKLTWADFIFAGFYDYLKVTLQMPDLDTKYPSFKKLVDNVMTLPQIKKYVEKAPKTD